MIKHVVMWKMKPQAEGRDAAANLLLMKEKLLALRKVIPQIVWSEVGFDFLHTGASYDIVLTCHTANRADFAIYQDHPEHVTVKQFIAKVTESRVVADYEVE
jgi:hypothetical protein